LALAYFERTERPVLVGQIALWLHGSLAEADSVLQELVEKGEIRSVTSEEKRRYYVLGGYFRCKPTK